MEKKNQKQWKQKVYCSSWSAVTYKLLTTYVSFTCLFHLLFIKKTRCHGNCHMPWYLCCFWCTKHSLCRSVCMYMMWQLSSLPFCWCSRKKIKQVVAMNTHLSNDTRARLTKGPHKAPHGYHLTNPHTGCSRNGGRDGWATFKNNSAICHRINRMESKKIPLFLVTQRLSEWPSSSFF